MNSLNPIFEINRAMYIITLLLYLACTPGMLFQIILGIIQVVSAIYLTINFYKIASYFLRKLIVSYWLLATIILITILIHKDIFSITGIILTFVSPMLIATLFMYLIYKLRKEINKR